MIEANILSRRSHRWGSISKLNKGSRWSPYLSLFWTQAITPPSFFLSSRSFRAKSDFLNRYQDWADNNSSFLDLSARHSWIFQATILQLLFLNTLLPFWNLLLKVKAPKSLILEAPILYSQESQIHWSYSKTPKIRRYLNTPKEVTAHFFKDPIKTNNSSSTRHC